jgi:hypothetical protein
MPPRARTTASIGRALSLALLGCALAAATSVPTTGCGRTPGEIHDPPEAGTDAETDAGVELITQTDKLDVLFVIDNTRTASFAHPMLSRTIPYFLDRLVNPRCVNGLGQIVDNPGSGSEACRVGLRDFAPVSDIHLAVISTSLGGHGADTCSPETGTFDPQQNDGAHLLARNAAGGVVPTYDGLGFIVWDPDQERTPPGSSDIDSVQAKLQEMIGGVGDRGCGFESQLESFYRFLIEPDPYDHVEVNNNSATLVGTDQVVLSQRADFLRDDSVVLIVLLSDEDDCSTRDGGQFFLSNQSVLEGQPFRMPRARNECQLDPDDPCCASCGQGVPSGCGPSSNCNAGVYDENEDPINLRCFDQKRRFGIDFLQPLDRYLSGLSERTIADRDGNVVPNPLFAGLRSPRMVLLTGVVGVPWQDIANAPTNIAAGFIPTPSIPWERILEDPETGDPPTDPLMIPSRDPRSGTNPVDGNELQPPTATSPTANPINGHEHTLARELQYACTYRLEQPVVCNDTSCECLTLAEIDTNPVCQEDNGNYTSVQHFGRATPATRPLRLLQRLGAQAVVTSICTEPSFQPNAEDFGYKPATDAMMRALRNYLVPFE